MRARIHFEWPDGTPDSVVLTGTEDEIREAAQDQIAMRQGQNPWSEILED